MGQGKRAEVRGQGSGGRFAEWGEKCQWKGRVGSILGLARELNWPFSVTTAAGLILPDSPNRDWSST